MVQFREYFREPGALFWSFAFPILMSYGLGIAFSGKNTVVRNIAIDETIVSASGKLNTFIHTRGKEIAPSIDHHKRYEVNIHNEKLGTTTYKFTYTTWDDAVVHMKRGNVSLIMTEAHDSIHFHFDPKNPEAQLIYTNMNMILTDRTFLSQSDDIKILSGEGTRYIDFLIPGLLAMGIMSSCLWGISYDMIDKRAKKLLRRMVATPMRKSNYMIAQLISRLVLAFAESVLLITFAYFTFHTSIQGSIPALILVFLSGNFVFIGIGILIASRTSNTQIGNGLISAITMPMMVLSGIFFSYYNFPDAVIPIIQKLPLTMFADGLRSIFIEGAGIMNVLPNIIILSLTGLITFTVGLKIFKWY